MTNTRKPALGVCSWSLQPSGPDELADRLVAAGVSCVQLALDPLRTARWSVEATQGFLEDAGIEIRSGMMAMADEDYSSLEAIARTGGVRPDSTWAANLAAAEENAHLAREMGIGLVTWHAGVLPEGRDDPERVKLLARVAEITAHFAEQGVAVGLETGQETARSLLDVLEELAHPALGVNFDPANMILYDRGDPIEALALLAPFVRQVHVKDARRTQVRGTWGEEVRVGSGDVDWTAFFGVLREREVRCDLMIEREAGDSRLADIVAARELALRHLRGSGA